MNLICVFMILDHQLLLFYQTYTCQIDIQTKRQLTRRLDKRQVKGWCATNRKWHHWGVSLSVIDQRDQPILRDTCQSNHTELKMTLCTCSCLTSPACMTEHVSRKNKWKWKFSVRLGQMLFLAGHMAQYITYGTNKWEKRAVVTSIARTSGNKRLLTQRD